MGDTTEIVDKNEEPSTYICDSQQSLYVTMAKVDAGGKASGGKAVESS